MNSHDPNPYEPSSKLDHPAPGTSVTDRDRLATTGLALTLAALFASGVVVALVGLGIVDVHWKSNWPGYWFVVCVSAAMIGWIVSIVAHVRRHTRRNKVGVIVGFLVSLVTTVLCLVILIVQSAMHAISC